MAYYKPGYSKFPRRRPGTSTVLRDRVRDRQTAGDSERPGDSAGPFFESGTDDFPWRNVTDHVG
jgi:hypothetical protein